MEPLGFSLEDRYLKRAGLDYWPLVDLSIHTDWDALRLTLESDSERAFPERLRCFSARGGRALFETQFAPDDILVFGSESKGLPKHLLEGLASQRVYLPIKQGVRSLNLANTVAVALYTAMHSAKVPMPDNDGTYQAPESGSGPQHPSDFVSRP